MRIIVSELQEAYNEAENDDDLAELLDEIGLYVYEFGVLGDVKGVEEQLEEDGVYSVNEEFELEDPEEEEEEYLDEDDDDEEEETN